ncbi:unnamed protein product [Blepharisma stoltei]|uniref:Uncharacterized protein n=1 Tax=Blepharisma stoltei TaxID=1481888 RepID=A0AAU9I8X2_9CILI|nr:unnamed protein product [Blepharisma stoltei]
MSSFSRQGLPQKKGSSDKNVIISQERNHYRLGGSWRAPHPQLVKVIKKLNPPSPCKLVRDKEQPISGSILRAIAVIDEPETNAPPKIPEKEVTTQSKKSLSFSLENSSILKRRVNRVGIQ